MKSYNVLENEPGERGIAWRGQNGNATIIHQMSAPTASFVTHIHMEFWKNETMWCQWGNWYFAFGLCITWVTWRHVGHENKSVKSAQSQCPQCEQNLCVQISADFSGISQSIRISLNGITAWLTEMSCVRQMRSMLWSLSIDIWANKFRYTLVSNIRHSSHAVHEYKGRPTRQQEKCLANRAYMNMKVGDLK